MRLECSYALHVHLRSRRDVNQIDEVVVQLLRNSLLALDVLVDGDSREATIPESSATTNRSNEKVNIRSRR